MKVHEQIIENHTSAVMVFERIFHRKPDMKYPQDIAILVEIMREAWGD